MYKSIPVDNPAKSEITRVPAPVASPTSADDRTHAGSSPFEFGTTIFFLAGVGFDAFDSQFSVPSNARA